METSNWLASRVNCSIGNKKNHFTDEELYDLIINLKSYIENNTLTARQKYAVGAIQTETTGNFEINLFKEEYNIPQKYIDFLLKVDVYAK